MKEATRIDFAGELRRLSPHEMETKALFLLVVFLVLVTSSTETEAAFYGSNQWKMVSNILYLVNLASLLAFKFNTPSETRAVPLLTQLL